MRLWDNEFHSRFITCAGLSKTFSVATLARAWEVAPMFPCSGQRGY